jgi:hypothetical protein
MRPIETIPGMECYGGIRENDGGGNSTIRSFINVTLYLQYNRNNLKSRR